MPKVKGVPNKHLHARTSFLYQAATYLTLQVGSYETVSKTSSTRSANYKPRHHSGLALQLGSQLQTVSRKGQTRLSSELKRSMCKSCNAILIPGRTSTQEIKNESKGGKKPWADVLVVQCTICGSKKRYPVGAERQKSKAKRLELESKRKFEKNNCVDESTISAIPEGQDAKPDAG